jgi:hypothetical protein
MGKAIGGVIQGVGGLKEAKAKRRDGKEFIAKAEQKQRNFERVDSSINHLAQVKISGEAEKLAADNIMAQQAALAGNAASAGIRGMGMINQIQQNTNSALASEAAKLSAKEDSLNFAKAQEQSRMTDRQIQLDNQEQNRIDSMLERGQALRSQGAAEAGNAAANIGGAIDQGVKDVGAFGAGGGFASGGFFNGLNSVNTQASNAPGTATNPYFGNQ